jgi:hypothetical protein
VVTYPHSTIRGQTYSQDSPYSLSGVAVQGAAARRIPLATWLFANVEGKLTAAWARVPIANGRATTPNVAFHALAGVGVQF